MTIACVGIGVANFAVVASKSCRGLVGDTLCSCGRALIVDSCVS